MGLVRSRIREASVSIVAAGVLLGCTSGSDAVPVPGADAVVDAPGPTIDRPSPTRTAPDDPAADAVATSPAPATGPDDDEVATPATVEPTASPSPDPSEAPQSADTTAAPPVTDASSGDVFLRVGDEGDEVGLMQFKLSVLGYLPAGSDTGVFDQATEAGLRRFQADYGLGVDGVFGPLTGRALNAAAQSVATET